MPSAYWPSNRSSVVFYDSALKRVDEDCIWEVLVQHRGVLERFGFGKRDAWNDLFYNSRSTMAAGRTSDGSLLEIGLRLDGRAEHERCIVFHARYV